VAESATLEQLKQYHRLLLAERQRRNPACSFDRDTAIEDLLGRLDDMGRRLRAVPDFVEPDPEEAQRAVERWFRERFG
jgi:hypothetical protein